MRRLDLNEKLYDDIIADTNDDPMGLVPPDLMHLIPGFISRRDRDVADLTTLLDRSDFAAIKGIGHKLKGTGVGFGFPLVTDIGHDLELSAANQDTNRVRGLIQQLARIIEGLKALIALKDGCN